MAGPTTTKSLIVLLIVSLAIFAIASASIGIEFYNDPANAEYKNKNYDKFIFMAFAIGLSILLSAIGIYFVVKLDIAIPNDLVNAQ